jgi:hypothetical protein
MRILPFTAGLAACVAIGASLQTQYASAQEIHSNYSAAELLSPCQEADNDARWGEAAETECEQYLIGYMDALEVTGAIGPDAGICLPDQNASDEVRWAFMRWVHGSYSQRTKMLAAHAVLETLKEAFPCS